MGADGRILVTVLVRPRQKTPMLPLSFSGLASVISIAIPGVGVKKPTAVHRRAGRCLGAGEDERRGVRGLFVDGRDLDAHRSVVAAAVTVGHGIGEPIAPEVIRVGHVVDGPVRD